MEDRLNNGLSPLHLPRGPSCQHNDHSLSTSPIAPAPSQVSVIMEVIVDACSCGISVDGVGFLSMALEDTSVSLEETTKARGKIVLGRIT